MKVNNGPIVYYDSDTDLTRITGKRVAIIGYGAQGRAQALNLRESGIEITVGSRAGSKTGETASEDGFEVRNIGEAVAGAQIIGILTPDETQGDLFESEIRRNLKPGVAVVFAHGFSVHYGVIYPPEKQDVILVAPMGPGSELRRLYREGSGLNAKIAVHKDYSGEAWMIALSYAAALGCGRAGIIYTTFAQETELDLFSEQSVLCGGIPALSQAAFEVLVEAGYPPELAYIECVREVKYIADLMYQHGLKGMRERISTTALYGGITRGERIINLKTKEVLRGILKEIKDGKFARQFGESDLSREDMMNSVKNEKLENAQKKYEDEFNKPES